MRVGYLYEFVVEFPNALHSNVFFDFDVAYLYEFVVEFPNYLHLNII